MKQISNHHFLKIKKTLCIVLNDGEFYLYMYFDEQSRGLDFGIFTPLVPHLNNLKNKKKIVRYFTQVFVIPDFTT